MTSVSRPIESSLLHGKDSRATASHRAEGGMSVVLSADDRLVITKTSPDLDRLADLFPGSSGGK